MISTSVTSLGMLRICMTRDGFPTFVSILACKRIINVCLVQIIIFHNIRCLYYVSSLMFWCHKGFKGNIIVSMNQIAVGIDVILDNIHFRNSQEERSMLLICLSENLYVCDYNTLLSLIIRSTIACLLFQLISVLIFETRH